VDRRYLEETWTRYAGDHTARLDALIARYSEPHRRYHTVAHLEAVWRCLDDQAPTDDLDVAAIYLAAAYHDAVYDPSMPDSEERSADLASAELPSLGHGDDRVALVRQIILDTKTHQPTSPESAQLSDADMAMLAAPRERYLRDAAAIRDEFALLDDELWLHGRTAFLRQTLAGPIFHVHHEREGQARANIEFELMLGQIQRRVIAAVDEREAASARRILAELPRLDRPFDEHADPMHITGSAIVIGPRGVVLHKHRKLGIWVQPGGHVDPGETPAQAAAREASEETGLPVELASDEVIHVDVHPGPNGHTHLDLRYLCTAPDRDPTPPPAESQEVFWLSWDAAIEMADDGLRGLLVARRSLAEH
jgi:predicted metal-dependent HD superfamily phosphohydrolase/8-oxo-dGTP pyrophosphatase MutT (NUDIX family)